jgi:DAACS family dicarboxylate/amino acid:cation (Na+ or H+) symporter
MFETVMVPVPALAVIAPLTEITSLDCPGDAALLMRMNAPPLSNVSVLLIVNVPMPEAGPPPIAPLVCTSTALTMLPEEKTRPMVRVLDALGEAIVKIIDFAMRLAPYGVFGLIFVVTSRFGFALLLKLGLYVAVVLVGLLLHGAISISALVRVFGGLSPRVFYSRIRASIITAFSTSSSNATLPTNIAVAEQELKIPPKIAGFVLPLGSTMCMNGTALFEGVTVLFLAQVFGVPLTLSQQVVVMILSVITAVGAAGVPGGSLPLLMGVLAAVNVEPLTIAMIIGVDRILDMARTTLNVVGDMSAAVYVARTESEWDPRAVSADAKLAA